MNMRGFWTPQKVQQILQYPKNNAESKFDVLSKPVLCMLSTLYAAFRANNTGITIKNLLMNGKSRYFNVDKIIKICDMYCRVG